MGLISKLFLITLFISLCVAIYLFPKETISTEILQPIKQAPIWKN